ncbi:MAG: hypothetical protein RR276_01850 [Angelakisella sp.]
MNNKLQNAFEPICATEHLKQTVTAYIHSEVAKQQGNRLTPMRVALACCAVLALAVCGIGGYHFYQAPVSYISVDVNPSVELALNRSDRVVAVTAYNEDGTQILQNLNLMNKPYTQAVELLLSDKTLEPYLSGDSLLSFTVISKKEEALLSGIQQCHGYLENRASCHGANAELLDEAHRNGLSFGKYQAYLSLFEYDNSITPEECQQLSMRQIRDRLNQYIGNDGTAQNPMENGNGNERLLLTKRACGIRMNSVQFEVLPP